MDKYTFHKTMQELLFATKNIREKLDDDNNTESWKKYINCAPFGSGQTYCWNFFSNECWSMIIEPYISESNQETERLEKRVKILEMVIDEYNQDIFEKTPKSWFNFF